jgi:hypothetical protein
MKYEFVLKQTHEYVLTIDVDTNIANKLANNEISTDILIKLWREVHTDDADMNDNISNISEIVTDFDHI